LTNIRQPPGKRDRTGSILSSKKIQRPKVKEIPTPMFEEISSIIPASQSRLQNDIFCKKVYNDRYSLLRDDERVRYFTFFDEKNTRKNQSGPANSLPSPLDAAGNLFKSPTRWRVETLKTPKEKEIFMRGRKKLFLDESSAYGRPNFPVESLEPGEFDNKDVANLKTNRKREASSSSEGDSTSSTSSNSSSSSDSSSDNEEIQREIQQVKKTRIRKPLSKKPKWSVDDLKKKKPTSKSKNTKGLKLKISKK